MFLYILKKTGEEKRRGEERRGEERRGEERRREERREGEENDIYCIMLGTPGQRQSPLVGRLQHSGDSGVSPPVPTAGALLTANETLLTAFNQTVQEGVRKI